MTFVGSRGPSAISRSPEKTLHRSSVTAVDGEKTDKVGALNSFGHQRAHIQVVPSEDATDVSIEVLWWSDALGKFISEQPPLTKTGADGVPYEFSVESGGRIMFVAVTSIATGSVSVYVGGSGLE